MIWEESTSTGFGVEQSYSGALSSGTVAGGKQLRLLFNNNNLRLLYL